MKKEEPNGKSQPTLAQNKLAAQPSKKSPLNQQFSGSRFMLSTANTSTSRNNHQPRKPRKHLSSTGKNGEIPFKSTNNEPQQQSSEGTSKTMSTHILDKPKAEVKQDTSKSIAIAKKGDKNEDEHVVVQFDEVS